MNLPPALDEALALFLGSGRRYFWPEQRSISAAVRTAFERPVRASRLARPSPFVRRARHTRSSCRDRKRALEIYKTLWMQPTDSMPLETAMGGLRYLAMLVATAEANGIFGTVTQYDVLG